MKPRPWMIAVALLVTASIGGATGFGAGWWRGTAQSSVPMTATSTHPVHWDDTSGLMRFSDGTSNNYVSACVPTTTGDTCTWNASTGKWQRGTGAGYDPSQPIVLEFTGGAQVNHGQYYGGTGGTVLASSFLYESALSLISGGGGYWWSDGYGGAHSMLVGFAGGSPTGNVFNGTTNISFGGFDGVPDGVWMVNAAGWDGANITEFVDGVPVGVVPFAGPRETVAGGSGGGFAMIGGSDHSNISMHLGWIRTYETVDPLNNMGAGTTAGCPYRPEWSPVNSQNNGATFANFLADYTKPSRIIPDFGDGYNGHHHPGQLWNATAAATFMTGRGSSSIDLVGGAGAPATGWPLPKWVIDTSAPFVSTQPTPPVAPSGAPSTPPGAKIFDSFTRADSDYAYFMAPSLGSTESGSLGPKAWSTKIVLGTNSVGQNSWSDWGIFKGRAVNLDCPVNTGTFGAIAWVMSDSPDMTVSADRNVPGPYDPNGNMNLIARAATDGSTFYMAQNYHGSIAVGYFAAGTNHWLITGVTASNAPSWKTMSLSVVGSTITLQTDGVTQWTGADTNVTTGNGAGMMRDPDLIGIHRWDNFLVK